MSTPEIIWWPDFVYLENTTPGHSKFYRLRMAYRRVVGGVAGVLLAQYGKIGFVGTTVVVKRIDDFPAVNESVAYRTLVDEMVRTEGSKLKKGYVPGRVRLTEVPATMKVTAAGELAGPDRAKVRHVDHVRKDTAWQNLAPTEELDVEKGILKPSNEAAVNIQAIEEKATW